MGRSPARKKEERIRGKRLPAWVNSLDTLMVDSNVAPQAGGGTEGSLTQATGKLFHGLGEQGVGNLRARLQAPAALPHRTVRRLPLQPTWLTLPCSFFM